MKHTSNIKGFDGTKEQLSESVGDLYYDSLADFLSFLSKKLKIDGDADFNRGRKKLAHELHQASGHLQQASMNIEKAWDICSPYVDEWLEKNNKERH